MLETFLQPALILLFFILWMRTRWKLNQDPTKGLKTFLVLDARTKRIARNNLHQYFKERRGQQVKVASLSGYHPSTVSKVLTGRKNMQVGFIERVLPYITLTLDDLLKEEQ